MNVEEIKGRFQDILLDYPQLHAQYDYDEKRNWFGICIYDDYHHAYTYATENDQIDVKKIRQDLEQWIATFAG